MSENQTLMECEFETNFANLTGIPQEISICAGFIIKHLFEADLIG